MEECGELIQECSKAIRCKNYYGNEKLVEEVGDVMCMLELLHEYDIISWTDVDDRVKVKKKKLVGTKRLRKLLTKIENQQC